MQCGDTWSVGSARKAGAWAGRCGWGWSAGLVVHERLGQTGFVSRLCLDGNSRTQAATSLQHAISAAASLPLFTPSSPLTSEGFAGKEGSTRGVWQTITLYHLEPTSRPQARGEGTGAYHECASLSSPGLATNRNKPHSQKIGFNVPCFRVAG